MADEPFYIRNRKRQPPAVKPALVRLLEWQIDQELERSEPGLIERSELLDSDPGR